MRRKCPLTHCITNLVVNGFTANVLLAVGASPAMVVGAEEASDFAKISSALLINVGTVSSLEAKAMREAAKSAHENSVPWLLDPVAIGFLKFRTDLVKELLELRPSVIKGNASEILTLAGRDGGGKGPDSACGSDDAAPYAKELARRTGAVVAVTGETDYVSDGQIVAEIPGGDPLLTKVTGTGCALGAVIAALCAAAPNPFRAAISGCALFAKAGENAAAQAKGPGSFAVGFLDELAALTSE